MAEEIKIVEGENFVRAYGDTPLQKQNNFIYAAMKI
jgi:hypothetical protein